MPIRLNNRFSPNAHKKKDILNKLKAQRYNRDHKENLLPKDNPIFPLLCISSYSVLLGYVENGDFQEWVEKRHVAVPAVDVLKPENCIVQIILKAVNLFPNPEAILDRLIRRLIAIRKNNKT